MSSVSIGGWQTLFRGAWHLFRFSFWRMLCSRQSVLCCLILSLASVAVVSWSLHRNRTPQDFLEQIFLTVFVSFLLPLFCLSYGTVGISGDREDRTLVYLLSTPLPRPWIALAKLSAALVLTAAWTLGATYWLCFLAGQAGATAWPLVWPGIAWATLAYVSLFNVFSILFRRATILGLAYALFLESLIGNMPGIAKRLAIAFYTRCLLFDAGKGVGLTMAGAGDMANFVPISAASALLVLWIVSALLLVVSLVAFSTREY